MRNLKLQYCKKVFLGVPNSRFLLPFQNAYRNDEINYFVAENKIYSCRADQKTSEVAEVPDIVAAEYITLYNEICVATGGGEVLQINLEKKTQQEGTFCDVGIEGMSWSPDQEIVVFITKTKHVVTMTSGYDPLAEHVLSEKCEGEGQFMNVGWGKKETQFHGTEGKMAAKQKDDFSPPENVDELPQNIEVSWRGDSAYFAVSFVHADVGRMFKVFDKEGRLQFISEKVKGLEPLIAWRPSGNWIAVPQLFPNKSTIALFEKNGLRHREFVLPFDLQTERIVALKWSNDSEIFSIQTRTKEAERIYLYTIGNYHWYLKQVLQYDSSDAIFVHHWDFRESQEKSLIVFFDSGKGLNYRFHLGIDKFDRTGLVAVIDGNKLLLTDFSKAVVPPPMCAKELQLDSYINSCTFHLDDEGLLQMCIYTAQREFQFFCTSVGTPLCFEPHTRLQPNEELAKWHLCHLRYFNATYIVGIQCGTNSSRLVLIDMDTRLLQYKTPISLNVKGIVNALTIGPRDADEFYVQIVPDKRLYGYTLKSDSIVRIDRVQMQTQQPVDSLEWLMPMLGRPKEGCYALCTNRQLYLNQQLVAEDVTSCCQAGGYLMYTKLSTLHFLRLRDSYVVDERKIERGAKLVSTIGNTARTIMQLPRGNLEAITPRVLCLEIVAILLDRILYNSAFDLLRKQRINLNIICDHNMAKFVTNLDIFLKQITNPNWLCLFLSDLRNEDFTTTMYVSNYDSGRKLEYPEGYKLECKVTYLCDLLCRRMTQKNDKLYRLPIITAYVKLGKLVEALQLVWQQKQEDTTAVEANKEHNADEMLKYLLLLVDVNELYDVALGTYNFGLVLFVAQKSQKDPKEFLPYLNELKALETNYRHFKIDEHLKRYEKALEHIAKCGAERYEEALTFIKKHELYRQALRCYSEQPTFYKEVCVAFGDYLRANAKLENASIMYERGGQLQQALLSAKHVLDWRRALSLARKDQQDVESVALSLAVQLQDHDRHLESFELLKAYGKDFKQALQALLNGRHYLQAIYEATMTTVSTEDENFLDSLIMPDLLEYAGTLEQGLNADMVLYVEYKLRLLNIRARKPSSVVLDVDDFNEVDLLSDTSSMNSSRYTNSSRGTGKTFRSSKNRRKHERKLLSLKPGNPFEDIALIDALHNLVTKVAAYQPQIRDTCKALLELQQDALANKLQGMYSQQLKHLENTLDEIWIPELVGSSGQAHLTGPNVDYTVLQKEQRYALIDPFKRLKPQIQQIEWTHAILH